MQRIFPIDIQLVENSQATIKINKPIPIIACLWATENLKRKNAIASQFK